MSGTELPAGAGFRSRYCAGPPGHPV